MPEPTHPPYESGALTTPRQLQRWLDINAQNGALTRTRYFITIPSFNIAHVWNGYSEIVGEYHYEAPNNFSLLLSNSSNLLSLNTNYTICVSYVNSDNTVVRYSLIRAANDLFYHELTPYAGQLIKKNFRIEIWNAGDGGVSSDIYDSLIYTSVLGHNDYRYGTDGPLIGADTLCEGQQSIGNSTLQPFQQNITTWLDAGDSGVELPDGTLWIDRQTGVNYTGTSIGFTHPDVNQFGLTNSMQFESTASVDNPAHIFLNFEVGNSAIPTTITLLSINTSAVFQLFVTSTNILTLVLNSTNTLFISGLAEGADPDIKQEYTVEIITSAAEGTVMRLYKTSGLGLVSTVTSDSGIDLGEDCTVTLGDSSNDNITMYTRGLIMYDTELFSGDRLQTLQYMDSLLNYNGLEHAPVSMLLPLTWGECAQPTLNT